MLVAFLGDGETARAALQYNLVAYGVTSFGLYFIMSVVGKDGPENMSSLRGLSRRHPGLAALLVLCMISLAGIPPLAGFLGKFMLFSAAAAQGHYMLVGLAVANAVISFYYYMLVVKEAYITEPAGDAPHAAAAIRLSWSRKLALGVFSVLLLVLGLCPGAGAWLAARGGP